MRKSIVTLGTTARLTQCMKKEFNDILDAFIERRRGSAESMIQPVRDGNDVGELAIRFNTVCAKHGRSIYGKEGLKRCANYIAILLCRRGYQDIRTTASIWSGWILLQDQVNWQEKPEFLRLWTILLETQDPTLVGERLPVSDAA